MAQIDDLHMRVDAKDHPLHATHEHVGRAEIREQRDDRRWNQP
jgi:hypothetical protein